MDLKFIATCSTTQFCDASKDIRVFNSAISKLAGSSNLIGKALTVAANGDILPVMKAIQMAKTGDVIVIAAGTQRAIIGEIIATVAVAKKIAGIVIDGYCRDIDAIQALNIPLYARGVCPIVGTKELTGEINIPIFCCDIKIAPGDIIFGDPSGLIAMTPVECETLLSKVQAIKQKEDRILELLKQKTPIEKIFNLLINKS